jgi:glyoxylase-like metal-dependent hydrolase (beta-lactamase superfamily II)
MTVSDGARFLLGDLEITIIHTPGHTTDSICLYIGDAVFTGDTLFVGKVGGTDFGAQARAEYESFHQKLLLLPDSTRVFPGHNYGVAPESTIGHERQTNPFLIQPDFESFVDLKRNWDAYKKAHGIA